MLLQKKVQIPLKSSYMLVNGERVLIERWYLCYRKSDPEKLEIWVGDASWKHPEKFRVYPDPCKEFANGT